MPQAYEELRKRFVLMVNRLPIGDEPHLFGRLKIIHGMQYSHRLKHHSL